jgi:hypothetical protein
MSDTTTTTDSSPSAVQREVAWIRRALYDLTHRKTKMCSCGGIMNAYGISPGLVYNDYWHFVCEHCGKST